MKSRITIILIIFNDVNSNLNIYTEPEKLETQSKHIGKIVTLTLMT